MGQFDDIRPYNNDEVPAVLDRLQSDDELVAAIASLKLGVWHKSFKWLVYPLIRRVIRRQLSNINTVEDFQLVVKHYLDGMVEKSTSGFISSGLDQLDQNKTYLFMSNHRDIALDPALVNYALHQNGFGTVRIAIGDNLLTKPYVTDLMRINKSFIVNRSATAPRQMLAAYKKLSAYIHHCITADHENVWIAHRQGRAKDGVDRTEAAMIKMISMSQNKKTHSFSEYIEQLNIVPVSISYEFDPCDSSKANELYEVAVNGQYDKAEHEDVESIAKGIAGQKGKVHVSFGRPLSGEFEDADAVAAAIDHQVVNNYVLPPTAFFAYKLLHGQYPEDMVDANGEAFDAKKFEAQEQVFQQRVNVVPAEHRQFFLGIYANAIESKRQFKV